MWADGTLTVDFESETTAYTDWVFTNFASNVSKSDVPAHGGKYIGTTNVKTTGSLQTKDKIATPKSITFYISKSSTNTTASSWKIQVSSDGKAWTDVKTVSASSVTMGEWTEVTQSLTAYSNVFVRIYYDGTTAVRCIDDVTLTYSGDNTNYKVNIANGIIGGSVASDKPTAKEGTTITLSAIPDDGYEFSSWDVTDTSTSEAIAVTDNKFTMPAANVNVSAVFVEKEKYAITWSINNNLTSQDVYEGSNIEFPKDIANPVNGNSKSFVGWTESAAIEGEPSIITNAKATENKTYYAVFANVTKGTSGTATITNKATTQSVSYSKFQEEDDMGNTWNFFAYNGSENIDDGRHFFFQINRSDNGYHISSPTFPSNVKEIKVWAWNVSEKEARNAYLCTSTDNAKPTTGDLGTLSIAPSTKNIEMTFSLNSDFKQFNIFSSAVIGFEKIQVTYEYPDIYSNYTTTIAPAPSSVNLNAKGYASFSSDYELSIDGATAYTAKVNEEAKTITWNAINDNVIPANEGVLLKGDAGEKATFAVSTTNKSNIADNDMRSNLVAKPKSELDGCIYVLSGENIIRLSDTGTVGANKAYFNLSQYVTNAESSTGAKTFTMIWNDGGIATGINDASTSTSNGIVYNLTGQRVNANAKGIVIIGGKKYINK